jgi:hypothetical protein
MRILMRRPSGVWLTDKDPEWGPTKDWGAFERADMTRRVWRVGPLTLIAYASPIQALAVTFQDEKYYYK